MMLRDSRPCGCMIRAKIGKFQISCGSMARMSRRHRASKYSSRTRIFQGTFECAKGICSLANRLPCEFSCTNHNASLALSSISAFFAPFHLQVAMMSFSSLPGTKIASESNVQELLIAREAYELGCLISIGLEEIEGFERHYALVKTCYCDYASVLPVSANQHQLQGLNLLGLLAQSKIAEFHTGLSFCLSHASLLALALILRGKTCDRLLCVLLSLPLPTPLCLHIPP